MKSKLDNVVVYCGPLQHRLYVARLGKLCETVEKQDRTKQLINAFFEFLKNNGDQVLSKDGKPEYEIRLVKV